MPSLPPDPTDPLLLADWLEIKALRADDKNSSKSDLQKALVDGGLLEKDDLERVVLGTFAELERRSEASPSAYPFTIDGGMLRVRGNWKDFPEYIFCLCLSYFGDKPPKNKKTKKPQKAKKRKIFPRRLFEHLSRDAAAAYVGGKALRFASPRDAKELPVAFVEAIEALCQKHICEGGLSEHSKGQPQDDTLDIVAWKDFKDARPGKLLLFGNCASGDNWKSDKLTSMVPLNFCATWMHPIPVSPIIRSVFIPHRVPADKYDRHTRDGGIIFDRCRVAHWVRVRWEDGAPTVKSDCIEWADSALKRGA